MRRACMLFCTMTVSQVSFAGGFALIEQGASGLGNAYAGAAAVSHDASTVWFNPAGMTELTEKEFLAAGHVIGVNSDFTDKGTTLNTSFGGLPVDPNFANAGGLDASGTSVVPNMYYVHPLRNGITLGVGFSVPFGNSTDYDRNWAGRYQAVESGVAALDINPSIAYRVNDQLSIGGGISIQHMSASLGSAVDSDATCLGLAIRGVFSRDVCENAGLSQVGAFVVDPATGQRLIDEDTGLPVRDFGRDGYADIEGDGVALSFNIGVLYKPRVGTKLGAAYRHGLEHDLDGTVAFTTNPALAGILDAGAAAAGLENRTLFRDGGVNAKASLPPTLMFSASHEVNDRLELLADATFTGWSSFDELRVVFDEPAQPDTFNTLAYNDVWRVAGGLNYEYSDQLILRAGVAYDEDPVPSPQLRTARIPGNERVWVAFGAGYQINSKVGVDVGFAHLMIDDTPIANESEAPGGTTVRGVFENNVNILSAQVTVQFD